jgi:hypothetical protein
MLVLAREFHHLRDLGFGDFECVDATFADPMLMDMHHDSVSILPPFLKKPLENMLNELHRRVVVIEQQNPIEARPLGLWLGLGRNADADVVIIGSSHAREHPQSI